MTTPSPSSDLHSSLYEEVIELKKTVYELKDSGVDDIITATSDNLKESLDPESALQVSMYSDHVIALLYSAMERCVRAESLIQRISNKSPLTLLTPGAVSPTVCASDEGADKPLPGADEPQT